MKELQGIVKEILESTNSIGNSCLYLSAFLVAMINDHTTLSAKFITGSLKLNELVVYNHSPVKLLLEGQESLLNNWDGHSWIEISGFIIDLSIFRTIFSSKTDLKIQEAFKIIQRDYDGYIIEKKINLIEKGLVYTIKEELTNENANVLIQNAGNIGLIKNNI